VVLGAQSSAQRAVRAAQLLERGFGGNRLAWLKPSLGRVDQLVPVDASPPNLRDEMCGPRRKRPAAEDEDDDITISADSSGSASPDSGAVAMYAAGLQPPAISMKASDLLAAAAAPAAPVIVYTGPARSGAAILEADAAETARQATAKERKKKGAARPKIAAKPDAADAKSAAGAKPAAAPKADKKPDAAPKQAAAKPAADAKPAAARPKSDSKNATKPAANKPAAKPDRTTSAAAPKS